MGTRQILLLAENLPGAFPQCGWMDRPAVLAKVRNGKTLDRGFIRLLGSSAAPAGLGFSALVPGVFFHSYWLGLGPAQSISLWCAIICTVMLVVGLIEYRTRAMWLAVPLAVALIWPVGFAFSYARCAAQNHGICPF